MEYERVGEILSQRRTMKLLIIGAKLLDQSGNLYFMEDDEIKTSGLGFNNLDVDLDFSNNTYYFTKEIVPEITLDDINLKNSGMLRFKEWPKNEFTTSFLFGKNYISLLVLTDTDRVVTMRIPWESNNKLEWLNEDRTVTPL